MTQAEVRQAWEARVAAYRASGSVHRNGVPPTNAPRDNYGTGCGNTDLRKSIDGLAALVKEGFDLAPFSLCLFAGNWRSKVESARPVSARIRISCSCLTKRSLKLIPLANTPQVFIRF
ncbi:hypothetical protein [Aneurinibacillus terranovensis]|uniref:hypothetical protein n=1 Tax=Aneurinibacillus terranovensis TaxID=278991 RepID=UPI000686FDC1|nr:hypothetical protein [Aneurinibacillus terranovensis]